MSFRRWLGVVVVGLILVLSLYVLRPTSADRLSYRLSWAAALVVTAVVLIAVRRSVVRTVNSGQVGVIERLGRFVDLARPGPVILLPFVETLRTLELSEQTHLCDEARVLTAEGIPIGMKMLVRFKLQRPDRGSVQKAAYDAPNWQDLVRKHAVTALHQRIGSLSVNDVLKMWIGLGKQIQDSLQHIAQGWGVSILSLELFDIQMPGRVGTALQDQRKAAIEVRSSDFRAAAEAGRIRRLSECLRQCGLPDAVLLDALQTERYIQALEGMSADPSTRIVVPIDFVRLLERVGTAAPTPAIGSGGQPPPAQAPPQEQKAQDARPDPAGQNKASPQQSEGAQSPQEGQNK